MVGGDRPTSRSVASNFLGGSRFDWTEVWPRYLLAQPFVEGRRVLELGTRDTRGLSQLARAGAGRVVGAATRVEDIEGPRESIELVSMPTGRLDFPDQAFEILLVVDLAAEVAANPDFLGEIRRLIVPDGLLLLGFAGEGHGIDTLFGVQKRHPVEPKSLVRAIRHQFPTATFYHQTPFVGLALRPAGVTERVPIGELTRAGAASYILASVGPFPVLERPRMVELPFPKLERESNLQRTHHQEAVDRLMAALRKARHLIGVQDTSLRDIQARIPSISESFTFESDEQPTWPGDGPPSSKPGVRRPAGSPSNDFRAVERRHAQIRSELEAERRRRRDLETRLRSLQAQEDNPGTQRRAALEAMLEARQNAISELQLEVERLRGQAEDAPPVLSLQEQVERLEGELSERTRQSDTQAAQHAQTVEGLRAQVRNLEAALTEHEERLSARTQEAGLRHEARLRELEFELVEKSARLQAIELARSEIQSQIRTLDNQQQQMQVKHEELQAALETSERERARIDARRQDAESALTEVETELANTRKKSVEEAERSLDARAVLTKERDLRADIEAQLRRTEKELAEARTLTRARPQVEQVYSREQVTALERSVERLAEALQASERERSELSTRLIAIENERNVQQQDQQSLAQTNEELRRRLELTQREAQRLDHVVGAHRDEIGRTAVELDVAHRALSDRESRILKMEESHLILGRERRALELTAQHLAAELDRYRERSISLRNERDTLATASQLLLKERDNARVTAQDFEGQIRQLEIALVASENAVERGEYEVERVQTKLEAAEFRTAALEDRAKIAEAEISSLHKSLHLTEEELRSKSENIQALHSELGEQLRVIEALKFNAEEAETRASSDQARLIETLGALTELNRDRQQLEERLQALQTSLLDAEEGEARAMAQKAKLEAQLVGQQAEDLDIRGQKALVLAQHAELKQRHGYLEALLTDTIESHSSLEDALIEAERERDELKARLLSDNKDEGSQTKEFLASEVGFKTPDELQLRYKEIELQLEASETELRQQRERVAALNNEQRDARMAMCTLESDLEDMQVKLSLARSLADGSAGDSITELRARVVSLEAELEDVYSQTKQTLPRKHEQETRLRARIAALEAELEEAAFQPVVRSEEAVELRARVVELETELDDRPRAVLPVAQLLPSDAEEKVSVLEVRLEATQTRLEVVERERAELETRFKTQSKALARFRELEDRFRLRAMERDDALTAMEDRLTAGRNLVDRLKIQLNRTEADLVSERKHRDELEKKLSQFEVAGENNSLFERLEERDQLELTLKNKTASLHGVESRLASAEAALQRAEVMRRNLESHRKFSEEEVNRLRGELDGRAQAVERAHQRIGALEAELAIARASAGWSSRQEADPGPATDQELARLEAAFTEADDTSIRIEALQAALNEAESQVRGRLEPTAASTPPDTALRSQLAEAERRLQEAEKLLAQAELARENSMEEARRALERAAEAERRASVHQRREQSLTMRLREFGQILRGGRPPQENDPESQ